MQTAAYTCGEPDTTHTQTHACTRMHTRTPAGVQYTACTCGEHNTTHGRSHTHTQAGVQYKLRHVHVVSTTNTTHTRTNAHTHTHIHTHIHARTHTHTHTAEVNTDTHGKILHAQGLKWAVDQNARAVYDVDEEAVRRGAKPQACHLHPSCRYNQRRWVSECVHACV